MDQSILDEVKKLLGFTPDYTEFDKDLVILINSTFSVLTQLGVGPASGFMITGSTSTWGEFVTDTRLTMVKAYVFIKAKLQFDVAAQTSYVINSLSDQAKEYEWRLLVASEEIKDG